MIGWPPGLLQDDDRKSSRWLASRPGSRRLVDLRCEEIRKNTMTTTTPNTTASGAAEAGLHALADRIEEAQGRAICISVESADYLRNALAASAPVAPAPPPAPINPRTQYLTVVYRGVEAGDEARVICDHPKVSAVSWSHALDDRDAALAAAPKAAPAPVSKSFDEWLEKQFEFRNYYFDLRGPGLMAIPFARRAYEAGRAPVAEDADPLQDAANWLVTSRATTSATELGSRLCIGYNRADRLFNAARAQAAQPEGAKP